MCPSRAAFVQAAAAAQPRGSTAKAMTA